MRNCQQVCIWIKKYRNGKEVTKTWSKFSCHLRSVKNWHSNQKYWKLTFFTKKYTDHKKCTIESPEILIRKLLSIWIETEKCVKTSKHAKNMFFDSKQNAISSLKSQNTQHVRNCIIRIWIQEAKGIYKSQKKKKKKKKNPCIHQNHVLMEFCSTIIEHWQNYWLYQMLCCIKTCP